MTAPNFGSVLRAGAQNIFAGAVGGAGSWLTSQLFGSGSVAGQAMTPPPFAPSAGGFDRPGFQLPGTNLQINPMAALPGGAPFVQRLTSGAIAQSPAIVMKQRRVCPRGWVLAIDGNCYPKQLVSRKFRMWKPDPRPALSRRDMKAINRAHAAKSRLVALTKKAGAHASMSRPGRRSAPTARMVQPRLPSTSIVNVE